MRKTDPRYQHFVQILREELVPAMGCTEPIALAYGAAKAREVAISESSSLRSLRLLSSSNERR